MDMAKQMNSKWALASAAFGTVAVLLLVLSGYGLQWGWWQFTTALIWIIPGSSILALIGFALSLVFGALRRNKPTAKGVFPAAMGLVLSMGVIIVISYWFTEAQQYPLIHDITTDIKNPPEFRKIVSLREKMQNDVAYNREENADLQRAHYPDIEPVYLDMDYPESFEQALHAARQMEWEQIVTADSEIGIIEAVDKVAWFGFRDDIVIRLDTTKSLDKVKLDIRSASRTGKSDLGRNAHRIRAYMDAVKSQE